MLEAGREQTKPPYTKVMEMIDPFLPIIMGLVPTVLVFLVREDDYVTA